MSGPRAENRDRAEFVTEGRRETRNKDDRDKIGGRINFFFNNSFAPRCASMPLSWPRSVLRPEVAAASQGTERKREREKEGGRKRGKISRSNWPLNRFEEEETMTQVSRSRCFIVYCLQAFNFLFLHPSVLIEKLASSFLLEITLEWIEEWCFGSRQNYEK